MLACAAFLLLSAEGAVGRTADRVTLPPRPAAGSLAAMDARLASLVGSFHRGGVKSAKAAARAHRLRLTPQGVLVVVEARSSARAARAAVAAAGGRVGRRGGARFEARVPLARLARLARDRRIKDLRAPALFVPAAVSEGVATTRANLWHAGGFTGTGVKVAILDAGFQGYEALLGTELPASVETHNLCDPGGVTGTTNHGTAVAEIVRDVAPGASLRLICFDSELDLQPAVAAAVAAGVSVIVHGVTWYNVGRGDGTGGAGTPDAAALSARQQGILWVNASGNQGRAHWWGTWTDLDGDDLHEWGGGSELNHVIVAAGETVCGTLRWDAWPTTDQDFDLYLLDLSDFSVVAASEGVQDGSQPPTEELCWQNTGASGSFGYAVNRFSASTSPRLDFFHLGALPPANQTEPGGIAEPASSPAVLAVGAVCRTSSSVEPFSARGPTIDGRPKPEVVGPHGVSTTARGASTSCADGFRGTSAAAAHVGGLAALVKQRTPSLTAGGIAAYLESLARSDDPVGRVLGLHPPLPGGPIAYELASGIDELGIANADGTTTPVPVFTHDTGSNRTPRFSPDGTKLAFTAKADTQVHELYLSNPDGSGRVRLTTGGAAGPDWSADGAKLYFIRGNDIWRVDANGSGLTQLTSSSDDPIGPLDVSPDGTKITYGGVSHIDGGFIQFNLFVANSDGTSVTPIASGDGTGLGAHFSPDGTRIAFHRNGDIYTINPNGTGETKLTFTGFPENESDPVWTPDGDIVFVSNRDAPGFGWTQLYRIEANGTGLTRLTYRAGPAFFRTPDLGPAAMKPVAADFPTIAGTLEAGRFLAASPVLWTGGWPFAVTRQWHRCNAAGGACAPIPGATDLFYRAVAADVPGTVRYTETATNGGGSSSVYYGLPASVAAPLVLGEPWLNITSLGVTLTATDGTWQGSPTSFLYLWQRSRAGEHDGPWQDAGTWSASPSRTLTTADLGSRLRVLVVAANPVGSAAAVSTATQIVGGQPVQSAAPRLDTSRQPFRVVSGVWDGYPAPTFGWQWYRWPSGFSPQPIPGATARAYQPTGADVGATLFAEERVSNSFGTGVWATDLSPPVALLSTAPPGVSGTAQVGQVLSASQGSWDPSSGLSFAYRWQRSTEGERWRDIAGATASAYGLVAADLRNRLRVLVTATGSGGSATAASAPTAVVAP